MTAITIPHRPFATERLTGLMLPDGIFEASLGRQQLNAQVINAGMAPVQSERIYVEATSHPGILVTPRTYDATSLASSATRVISWDVDLAGAPAGAHYVSFVVESPAGRTRIIKKIFVLRTTFDPSTLTFHAETPEGTMAVRFKDFIGPRDSQCCPPSGLDKRREGTFLEQAAQAVLSNDFRFCSAGYLPRDIEVGVTPAWPFAGQFGDLPFNDPWWKIVLCIVALLLLIASAIAEAVDGDGTVVVGGGTTETGSPVGDCCGIRGEGGGTSYVAAGLAAAAAAAATAAALSDAVDPVRRGQEHTSPAAGELTTSEDLQFKIRYLDPVALGRPFAIGLDWTYVRTTTGQSYTYSASDTQTNQHVLTRYEIDAPDVVRNYQKEPWIVRARFFGPNDVQFRGGDLFVQCLLAGPHGEYRRFVLEDDGAVPDDKANDGEYTGVYVFEREHMPRGIWTYYVVAQDVNHATPDMTPEDAARIIGGFVVTHQLTIDFSGGTCPFVADGHVNVV